MQEFSQLKQDAGDVPSIASDIRSMLSTRAQVRGEERAVAQIAHCSHAVMTTDGRNKCPHHLVHGKHALQLKVLDS